MKKIRVAAALCAAFLLALSVPTVAYASGGEEIPEQTEIPATETTSEPNPFTPAGTGTVVNTATDEDGKRFYTITTPDENVFYLVIDLQRETDNVYFLDTVTERDLLSLAEKSGDTQDSENVSPAPESEPAPEATPESEASLEPSPAPEQTGNTGMLLMVLAVVIIGGGIGYYFKIYRPKHQQADAGEEYEAVDAYEADAQEDDTTPELDADEEENAGDGEE